MWRWIIGTKITSVSFQHEKIFKGLEEVEVHLGLGWMGNAFGSNGTRYPRYTITGSPIVLIFFYFSYLKGFLRVWYEIFIMFHKHFDSFQAMYYVKCKSTKLVCNNFSKSMEKSLRIFMLNRLWSKLFWWPIIKCHAYLGTCDLVVDPRR